MFKNIDTKTVRWQYFNIYISDLPSLSKLSNLTKKNTNFPLKFEFMMKDDFNISMFHAILGIYLYKNMRCEI